MELALFELKRAKSYSSFLTGLVRSGDTILLPAFLKPSYDKWFEVTKTSEGTFPISVEGGLGDKIYALPALYQFDGRVGINQIDEPIYRLVRNKVEIGAQGANLLSWLDPNGDLSEGIAERLGVDLKFRMPVLQTTEEEKLKAESGCIVLCSKSTEKKRCWEDSDFNRLETKLRQNYKVYRVTEKSCNLFQIVEAAEAVITVNTSCIPMAGAFQVPFIYIEAENRTENFLDAYKAERDNEQIEEILTRILRNKVSKCWCGGQKASLFIESNLRLLKCSKCGTVRQDVKLTKQGLNEFYSKYYDFGWREVVEGQRPYEFRYQIDLSTSISRWTQWFGSTRGKGTWLDVGTGNGALLEILKERGMQPEGLDLFDGICNEFKIRTWDTAGKYDFVSFIDSFEHMDPNEAIDNINNHLNENGKVIVELPDAVEEPRHYRRLQHLFFWTEETIQKFMEKRGFKINKFIRPTKGKLTVIAERIK